MDSVEGVAAGAGAGRGGVVDREPLLLDGVDEVDRRPLEVRRAHAVDDHVDAVEVGDGVAVELPLVEEQLVTQTRAASRLHRDAQLQVVAPLLLQQALDLAGGGVGKLDTGGLSLGFALNRHCVSPKSERASAGAVRVNTAPCRVHSPSYAVG